MKRSHRLIVAAGAALLVSYLAWEWYLSPQARIERFLGRVVKAAEEKDSGNLIAAFSREYSDFRGMDYETLTDLIERGFTDVDRLNVTLAGVSAEVEGESGRASFDLMVVAVRGRSELDLADGDDIRPGGDQHNRKRRKRLEDVPGG